MLAARGAVFSILLWLALAAVLAACGGTPTPMGEAVVSSPPQATTLPRAPMTPTPAPTAEPVPTLPPAEQVNLLGRQVVVALRDQHLDVVAQMVHPQVGLTFSPEAYIDPADQRFSPEVVAGLMTDPTVYYWGAQVGSGDPLNMNFAEYYGKYVFDKDYAAASQVSVGQRLAGQGGMIDNTGEAWPGSMLVEYHYPGSARYDGMDWTSLRLIFQQVEATWFLVGVVHDAWSP